MSRAGPAGITQPSALSLAGRREPRAPLFGAVSLPSARRQRVAAFSISTQRFHSASSAPTVTRLPFLTMGLTSAMGSFISSARIRLSVDMWATGRSSAFLPERSTRALAPAAAANTSSSFLPSRCFLRSIS